MKPITQFSRACLLMGWSLALTGLTGVLGGAPLKALRLRMGGLTFWFICSGVSTFVWGMGWPSLGVMFLLMTILVGTHTELELRGLKSSSSGLIAIATTSVFAAAGALLLISRAGPGWKTLVQSAITAQLQKFATPEVMALMKPEEILYQIPSLVIVMLIVSLGLTLVLEKPIAQWAGVTVARKEKLRAMSLPDSFIWLFIFGLLLAFWRGGEAWMQPLGMNLLNVAVVGYFFQGLAVVCTYFEVYKVGPIWRSVILVLFIFQLFLALSLIGVLDFWVDFRVKITKRAAAIKRKRLSE